MRFSHLVHVLRQRLRVSCLGELANLIEIEQLEHALDGSRDLGKGLLGANRHQVAGERRLGCRLPTPFLFS